MSLIQSSSVTNATDCLLFSYPKKAKRQQRFRVSCSDFRKEMSVLNLKTRDVDQIKKAYRKMALQYHPDVCDPSQREESTRMFIEIQKAYTSLLDQELLERDGLETRGKWESQLFRLQTQSQRRLNVLDQESLNGVCLEKRNKWEGQLSELKRESQRRREQKDGSWGCRVRAKHHCS